MENTEYGFLSAYNSVSRYSRVFMVLLAMLGLFTSLSYGDNAGSVIATSVVGDICVFYNVVHSVIFVLGITMVILGGALYAGSHVVPGQTKGTVQGYAMGFILGGVIGVVIAMMAPYIIGLISSQSSSSITTSCSGS